MTMITTKWVASDAIDGTKIKLKNNEYLKARNAADSADINIVKVNASDRIEFASIPQVTSDASSANDLVRLSQVQSLLEGLKPKQAVVAVSIGSDVDISLLKDGDILDTVTLATGDRVLLKDQTLPVQNGIYVVGAIAGGTVRSTDMNSSSEVLGAYTTVSYGSMAGYAYVTQVLPTFVLDTDALTFVVFKSPVNVTGGDMITVSGSVIAVDLAAVSGLESTNAGNAAGQLRAKVDAVTVKINGSNQLKAAELTTEIFTLVAGDITNQYIELLVPAISAESISIIPVGGIEQLFGVDYTVSLTGGTAGTTRITFAGDLATAGAAALVSGDKLIVKYSKL